jgi:hypothetical protein
MPFDLDAYLDDELPVLDAVDLTDSAPSDRPTEIEIWYWKIENSCLDGTEHKVLSDDELLDLHGFPSVAEWGWLFFIVKWLGMYGILASNWGLPILKVGESARFSDTNFNERMAQSVRYFIEIMSERGYDPLKQIHSFAEKIKAGVAEQGTPFADEQAFLDWLLKYNEWFYYVYVAESVTIRPEVLNAKTKLAYSANQAAEFLPQIRAAAANRRARWNAPHSPDFMLNRERRGAGRAISVDSTLHRANDLINLSDDELLPKLKEVLESWRADPKHTFDEYICSGQIPARERLQLIVAHHDKLREMLREPENRELAEQVKADVKWFYLPYAKRVSAPSGVDL